MFVRQLKLYGIVLVLAFVVVLVALGGGLFGQSTPWQLQWQHKAFFSLCHQIPDRSFWINGQPMAVCSRCIGIYSGFLLGWLTLPLFSFFKEIPVIIFKKVAVVAVLFNVVDGSGYLFGLWENTLVSRTVLGSVLGMSGALIFIGEFFHR